jgi:hypothetical protein
MSGYGEYRFGDQRPVYRPGKKGAGAALNGDRRAHVIEEIKAVLRDFKSTPFEHEADCWHGLRRSLCLAGHGWHVSDATAADIVGEALRAIGARRPSWEQGQREHVDYLDTCSQCGRPMPEEMVSGGRRYRYCSSECARVALERKDFQRRDARNKIYEAASRLIKKSRTKPRNCAYCGGVFHPVREASSQQFCSHKCRGLAARGRVETTTITKTCIVCGQSFLTSEARAQVCGRACSAMRDRIRNGTWRPRAVTPRVFDALIQLSRTSGVASASTALTPIDFDAWFKEAA